MTVHYPRVRIYTRYGDLYFREGVSINFYMRHSHDSIAQAMLVSLEAYLRAVGPAAIGYYVDEEGEHQQLDGPAWMRIRSELLESPKALIRLRDAESNQYRYRFEYYGKLLGDPVWGKRAAAGCAASFWLPTEFMEEHGPQRVRELALDLASPLPFASGHAGLSFNGETEPLSMSDEERTLAFRYPGMDRGDLGRLSWTLGTKIRGAHWLTFLGPLVLGEVGGVEGLRSRLSSPETHVQEMDGGRAVVTLGEWPEAGDTQRGQMLPAYRELARVLEPWHYDETRAREWNSTDPDLHRWERRFLD